MCKVWCKPMILRRYFEERNFCPFRRSFGYHEGGRFMLSDSVRHKVWDRVWDPIWTRVRTRVRFRVWVPVWDPVWGRVRRRARRRVWDRVLRGSRYAE